MLSILKFWIRGVTFAVVSFMASATLAQQVDIRLALNMTIQQLQTGQLSPNWYSPQLWQTISLQTGNSGIYTALRDLGPVTNMVVNQQMQLPLGPIYSITAQHQNGVSNWTIGVNTIAGRLEYANFSVGSASAQLPGALPGAPLGPYPTVQQLNPPVNPPPPSSPSTACKKFPDLC